MAEKLIAENRRARHDYHFLDRFEAGLVLSGSEVKSLRQGHAVLQRAYADARDGELWLIGLHIPPYEQASIAPHDPDRDRKLLLHRREIDRLTRAGRREGPDRSCRRGSTSRTAAPRSSWRSRAARKAATSAATSPTASRSAASSAS